MLLGRAQLVSLGRRPLNIDFCASCRALDELQELYAEVDSTMETIVKFRECMKCVYLPKAFSSRISLQVSIANGPGYYLECGDCVKRVGHDLECRRLRVTC